MTTNNLFFSIYNIDICNQYEYEYEGYKPFPFNCGIFCQCAPLITGAHHVPDSHGSHGGHAVESYQVYSWVKQYCPIGTKWSQKLKTCDHAENVQYCKYSCLTVFYFKLAHSIHGLF